MKKLVQIAVSALIVLVVGGSTVRAQMTTQTVSIAPGYTNQTFYSMNNGVLSSVSNTDWDLGFQLRGYTGSILINSKNNVKLYRANKAVSEWSTMQAYDTNGVVNNPAFELFNSETSWNFGAFNRTNNPANPFDLGWGVYDLSTHMITGDSIFFIKLPNGVFKKFQVIDLDGLDFIYTFRWADLDGTNEQTRILDKADYPGKHFAYYTLTGDSAIDREPVLTAWDLTFCQYVATLPVFPYSYKVAGVLLNDSVFAAKAYPVDTATVALNSVPMQPEINTIGFDWKFFDQPNNLWVIADSLVYFVQDRQLNPWKVIFTGFGGAANGNFIFQQSPAATVGLGESVSMQTLGLFPNPASSLTRLMVNMTEYRNVQLLMTDLSGRSVRTMNLNLQAGIQSVDLDLSGLNPGLYTVVLTSGADRQVSRLVVN
jgi:hypothetical protein